jgi:FkbM family methyltransferase
VVAFEPLPANATYIRKMLRLNKFININVIEKAVISRSGSCFFDIAQNNHIGHVSQEKTALQVEAVSLDDFVETSQIKPDFVKIDVEGGEGEVLAGMKNQLASAQPIPVIEIHSPEQAMAVATCLQNNQYRMFQVLVEERQKREKSCLLKLICKMTVRLSGCTVISMQSRKQRQPASGKR